MLPEDGPTSRAGGDDRVLIGRQRVTKSLTIVLPVYNAETRLRKNVTDLLELASELTPKFGVLIIDDGSTDDTFEVAEELAAHYPQVLVRRHRHRRGLGATIEYVQRRVRSDAVMVHDGVTPVNPQQMRSVWQSWITDSSAKGGAPTAAHAPSTAIHDFANLSSIHAAMEQAHRRVVGFQLITRDQPEAASWDGATTAGAITRPASPQHSHAAGVGQIPAMPRPKFLTALAAFALGE
jgi:cellulose synthase/poly-beta-1,6-N-acetylglucosamine synthase-like glycosyltransferase